jgi:hypothetical protein
MPDGDCITNGEATILRASLTAVSDRPDTVPAGGVPGIPGIPGLPLPGLPDLSGTSIRKELVDRFIVASYGGVASKTLIRGLLDHPPRTVRFTLVPRHHTHQRRPSLYLPSGKKVIYLYGDPAHSVGSFFRRDLTPRSVVEPDDSHPGFAGFARAHCKHLGGEYKRISEGYSLEDFLSSPGDPFGLEDHFHQWTEARVPYPILLVRYETLWDHLEEIYEFVGLPRAEAATFPLCKKTYLGRHSEYDEPMARLRLKYTRLLAAIERLPPISLLPATPQRGWRKIRYNYERLTGSYRRSFV